MSQTQLRELESKYTSKEGLYSKILSLAMNEDIKTQQEQVKCDQCAGVNNIYTMTNPVVVLK